MELKIRVELKYKISITLVRGLVVARAVYTGGRTIRGGGEYSSDSTPPQAVSSFLLVWMGVVRHGTISIYTRLMCHNVPSFSI